MDLVVASIAVSLGATVATSNARHFLRVPGLHVDDWSRS
jgi:predicted nucleic acid-binding protein